MWNVVVGLHGCRLWRQMRSERRRGREPVVDASGRGVGGVSGVPVGGMGSGAIGRSWTGDFEPGRILPQRAQAAVVPANQFAIFVQPDGGTFVAKIVMTCSRNEHVYNRNGIINICKYVNALVAI